MPLPDRTTMLETRYHLSRIISPHRKKVVAHMCDLALRSGELIAECDALREQVAELSRLCEKALTRSAIVHPSFADEIRAALAKVQS